MKPPKLVHLIAGLSALAGIALTLNSIAHEIPRKTQEELSTEYVAAAQAGRERYLTTLNVFSKRTGDRRNCAFYGVDLDGDGMDDIRREETPFGQGMHASEYYEIR